MENGNKRHSGIELLRVVSIIGILSMHIYGDFIEKEELSIFNTNMVALYSAVFSFCVVEFMLISGYFGLNANYRKLFQMNLIMTLYSIIDYIVMNYSGVFCIKGFLLACVPVLARKNWFFTCYFVLVLISPYLNKLIDHMDEKEMKKMLMVLLAIFSVFTIYPEFVATIEGGKGIVQVTIIYMIGRYLRLYPSQNHSPKRYIKKASLALFFILILNLGFTIVAGHIITWAAMDHSLFVILYSIYVFQVFCENKWRNQWINKCASCSMAVLMLEAIIRRILLREFDIYQYGDNSFLLIIVLGISVIILMISVCIELFRRLTLTSIENCIMSVCFKLWEWLKKCLQSRV